MIQDLKLVVIYMTHLAAALDKNEKRSELH